MPAYLTCGAANILIGLLHIIVRWRLQQLRRVLLLVEVDACGSFVRAAVDEFNPL
jgi:hypothetical protein